MIDLKDVESRGKGISILLLGLLAILFGDIFPGSSQGWFLDIVGIFITLPLYLLQVLVAYNWAYRNQKLNFKSLYFFGMFIALTEETWGTKVIYAGATSASNALLFNIGGFAIIEFLILVFFWHPLITINLTLFTFQALSVQQNHKIHTHDIDSSLPMTYRAKKVYFLIAIMVALVMGLFGKQNVPLELITLGITIIIISLLYIIRVRWTRENISLFNLHLSNRSFRFSILLLFIIYILMFFFYRPEAMPPWHVLVITLIFYIPILSLICRTPRKIMDADSHSIGPKCIFLFLYITLFLTVIAIFIPNAILEIIVRGIYGIAIIIGVIIFLKALKK